MTYYVRDEGGAIDGPFPVEHIRQLLDAGKLNLRAGIVEGRGQRLSDLQNLAEWQSISQLLDGSGGTIQLDGQTRSGSSSSPIVNRYRDAFRVADALVALGNVIKAVGAVLAIVIILGSFVATKGLLGGSAAMLGIAFGALIGGVFWVGGVVVAAQGEVLRATLDTSVSNSPFLTNHERLDAMRLPRSLADRASG